MKSYYTVTCFVNSQLQTFILTNFIKPLWYSLHANEYSWTVGLNCYSTIV